MNSYAIRHPRLDVVAIVSAPSSLDAMWLLMSRDGTWGDLGLGEAVYLGKAKVSAPCYSLFGQDDCEGAPANINDVLAEIDRRRREHKASPRRFARMFRAAIGR